MTTAYGGSRPKSDAVKFLLCAGVRAEQLAALSQIQSFVRDSAGTHNSQALRIRSCRRASLPEGRRKGLADREHLSAGFENC